MMKSKDLILRKTQLLEQKKNILKQIDETTANMNRVDLEKFIASGDSAQIDGHKLDLLRRKHTHLVNLEGSLNLEIGKLRKKEREKAALAIQKEKQSLELKQKILTKKIERKLKEVNILKAEEKKFFDPLLVLAGKLKEQENPQEVDNFKLSEVEVEGFLGRHYVKYPEQIKEKNFHSSLLFL